MELDIGLKMRIMKLFWQWDYVPSIDIRVYHTGAASPIKYEITDVDVIGVKITEELHPKRIMGDCNTQRSGSPINRAFWLSGLMRALDATQAFHVSTRRSEFDHRTAAQSLGVDLLTDQQLTQYERAVLSPGFPHDLALFDDKCWRNLISNMNSFKPGMQLWEYTRTKYWRDPPHEQVRRTLSYTQDLCAQTAHRSKLAQVSYVHALLWFSCALCHLISDLFRANVLVGDRASLDSLLKAYIYGGMDNYERLKTLKRQVLQTLQPTLFELGDSPVADVTLPEWGSFLELCRAGLIQPYSLSQVPRLLCFLLFERQLRDAGKVTITEAMPKLAGSVAKLAHHVLSYFSAASGAQRHVSVGIEELIEEVILSLPADRIVIQTTSDANAEQSE